MTGVDLATIDGIDAFTALKVVSEIGADMARWQSAKHFASWLGLSPDNRITGGKVISSRTKANANRAATALRLSANALHRSDGALGTFLRRKKAQLGAPKAITATAHKLARIIYTMLRCGVLRNTISSKGAALRQATGSATGLPACSRILYPGLPLNRPDRCLSPKPIPRWDVHFGILMRAERTATAPHLTFSPNWVATDSVVWQYVHFTLASV